MTELHIKGREIRARIPRELLETLKAGEAALKKARNDYWDLPVEKQRVTDCPPFSSGPLSYVPGQVYVVARALDMGDINSAYGPDSEGYVTYTFRRHA